MFLRWNAQRFQGFQGAGQPLLIPFKRTPPRRHHDAPPGVGLIEQQVLATGGTPVARFIAIDGKRFNADAVIYYHLHGKTLTVVVGDSAQFMISDPEKAAALAAWLDKALKVRDWFDVPPIEAAI